MHGQAGEADDLKARLRRTEGQLANLVSFIEEGDGSPTLRERLRALESQAEAERAAVARHEASASVRVTLPSDAEIRRRITGLDGVLAGRVPAAREALRRIFGDGGIQVAARGKSFVARGVLLPLAVITEPAPQGNPRRPALVNNCGSGGKI